MILYFAVLPFSIPNIPIHIYANKRLRNSLVVQWLCLGAFTARARVLSLVGELGSHKPCSAAKKKKAAICSCVEFCFAFLFGVRALAGYCPGQRSTIQHLKPHNIRPLEQSSMLATRLQRFFWGSNVSAEAERQTAGNLLFQNSIFSGVSPAFMFEIHVDTAIPKLSILLNSRCENRPPNVQLRGFLLLSL